MTDKCAIGFITMAFGKDKYIQQAEVLARSLRRHMPNHPIAIVTDRPDPGPLFDIVIPIDQFSVAGTFLKTGLYRYSPFSKTLFIDSDCIVARDFSEELRKISSYEFSPVVSRYLSKGDKDVFISDVGRAIEVLNGTPFPKFNGGIYFYRKGDFAREVFDRAVAIRDRSTELGILDFDSSGPGEETLFGLALSQMHVTNLYDDAGRLMRTPLNSTGPIHLDVIRGECRFIKEGALVEPAICHFCGEWINHPAYLIARRELLAERSASIAQRLQTHLNHRKNRFGSKVRRKLLQAFQAKPRQNMEK